MRARSNSALKATGRARRRPPVDRLRADIDGSYASHTLEAGGRRQVRGEALALTLAAAGQLQQLPQGLAWDGTVVRWKTRLPRLQMQQPLA